MARDIIIGIPSYKRAEKQLTLDYLERLGWDKHNIIMSVQSAEDLASYTRAGTDKRVGRLIYRQGANIADNRNTLLDAVPAGTFLLMMDDDVHCLELLKKGALQKVDDLQTFRKILDFGFSAAVKRLTVGWGVYPLANAFYMSAKVTDKTICDGQVFGVITSDLRFNSSFTIKEDYQFACEIMRKYGAFPRLDMIAANAQSKTKGGCEEFRRDNALYKAKTAMLLRMYPELLRENPRRPGEVLMRPQAKARKRGSAK